MSNIWQIETGP